MEKRRKTVWSKKLRGILRGKSREKAVLCVLLATVGGIGVLFLLLLLFAAVLSSISLPLSVFDPAALLLASISSMAAGYLSSLLSRERGFFYGLCCGFLLFLMFLLVSLLVWKEKLGAGSGLKLLIMLLSGAIGGVWGVNSGD